MGSSVRETPDTFLLDLIKDLQSRIEELESNSLTQADAIMESLQVGEPVNSPGGFGDASFAGDLIGEGNLNLGSPTTPATAAGDGAISGDLSIEGTITGTGLVTGGDSHDHDGGDGAAIPTAGIANDAIDDTKAGDRVPQFYRRKGGSSSSWASPGSSNYTPGAVRMQGGFVNVNDSQSVSFPTSFSNSPLVICMGSTVARNVTVGTISSSSFTITVTDLGGSPATSNVFWLAVGPE